MPTESPRPEQPPADASEAAKDVAPPRRKPTTPPYRRLRAFAFDPLLSTQLDTAGINQVVMQVNWEDPLGPGPVGEYLEVVDYDPAAGCFYDPVDLNALHPLATDGLAPSEGNPGFHQQMVYAVAMTTIHHFETALGRKAQWALGDGEDDQQSPEFVRRLRIYPHALREANAYFSPAKQALLFGYFPASSSDAGRNLPGGTVFTCLSHDVIAHETTHALLHGLRPHYLEETNPDILAFHEAFADIVALLQHFTFPEVLRKQIAATRGDLGLENILGQLARQFGEAVGYHGALRDAIGQVDPQTKKWVPLQPDPSAYQRTFEPHARGALLVAAVFDGFLTIYRNRIADLLRVATGGTGILPAGNIHPDLVNRLAQEASRAARHVLTMCIRALDYCPPVDLTFGEYLRALITADYELVHDDDLNYRLAMVEAFRRRGLFPSNVRSLAPDSLLWTSLDDRPELEKLMIRFRDHAPPLLRVLNDWRFVELTGPDPGRIVSDRTDPRKDAFEYEMNVVRRAIRDWFEAIRRGAELDLQELTGLALAPDAPRCMDRRDGRPAYQIRPVRPSRRVGPDGQLEQILVVELTQQRPGFLDPDLQARSDREGVPENVETDFTFRGGCTLIFNLETAMPRFVIHKGILSEDRRSRRREYLTRTRSAGLSAIYFGRGGHDEPFALVHRNI